VVDEGEEENDAGAAKPRDGRQLYTTEQLRRVCLARNILLRASATDCDAQLVQASDPQLRTALDKMGAFEYKGLLLCKADESMTLAQVAGGCCIRI